MLIHNLQLPQVRSLSGKWRRAVCLHFPGELAYLIKDVLICSLRLFPCNTHLQVAHLPTISAVSDVYQVQVHSPHVPAFPRSTVLPVQFSEISQTCDAEAIDSLQVFAKSVGTDDSKQHEWQVVTRQNCLRGCEGPMLQVLVLAPHRQPFRCLRAQFNTVSEGEATVCKCSQNSVSA